MFSVFGISLLVFLGIGAVSFTTKVPLSKVAVGTPVKQQQIVAGQEVKWTMLVEKSQIVDGKHLIQLPRHAEDVKINTVTKEQADNILSTPPIEALSLKQRQTIAIWPDPKPAGNKVFLAAISPAIKNFLFSSNRAVSKSFNFLFASLTDSVSNVIESISGTQPTSEVTETIEATYVNVPDEIVTTPVEIVPEQNLSGRVEAVPTTTPEITSTPEVAPAPTETTPEATITPSEVLPEQSSSEQTEPTPEVTVIPEDFVKVEYTTPAPQIFSELTDSGQQVTVSSDTEDPQAPLVDVLASTRIPKIFKVGQEDKIQIKWENNNNQDVVFHAYDTNNDGYLDYVEWTVPHLSTQIFNIIFISKAFQLDAQQNIVADIYDSVRKQDNTYVTITDGQYIRVTFEQLLNNKNDNTIFAKATDPNTPARIEVYPAYTDAEGNITDGPLVATFENIKDAKTYKVLLTNLQNPTDLFDLKVIGSVEVDYVVDPTTFVVTIPGSPIDDGATFGNTSPGTKGIDFPDIGDSVDLAGLSVTQGSITQLASIIDSVGTGAILLTSNLICPTITGSVEFGGNNTYNTSNITGSVIFSGENSYNAGTINGNVEFRGTGSANKGNIVGEVYFNGDNSYNSATSLNPYIYVVNNSGDTIQKFDSLSLGAGAIATGTTNGYPWEVILSRDGRYAYVVNTGGNFIQKFDTSNLSGGAVATGITGGVPYSVALSLDGRYAFVVNNISNTIEKFDTSNLSGGAIETGLTGFAPTFISISPDGLYAYVANLNSGTIQKFDTSNINGGAIATGDTGLNGPRSLAISPDGLYIYVAGSTDSTIKKFETANLAGGAIATGNMTYGSYPYSVIISSDGLYAYVANSASASIQKFDTSNLSGGAVATGTTGFGPQFLAFSPDGLYIYVVNAGSDSVQKFDTSNLAGGAVATGNTGTAPASVAVSGPANIIGRTHFEGQNSFNGGNITGVTTFINTYSFNSGTITGDTDFHNFAHNEGVITGYTWFFDNSDNSGTITGGVTFDLPSNSTFDRDMGVGISGIITFMQPVIFNLSAHDRAWTSDTSSWVFTCGASWIFSAARTHNSGIIVTPIGGSVTFLADDSYNAGTINDHQYAVEAYTISFTGANSYNAGPITGNTQFLGQYSNNKNTIQGDVIFTGTNSYNAGPITGNYVTFGGENSYNAKSYAYVVNNTSRSIQRFDASNLAAGATATGTTSGKPVFATLSPDGQFAYVANSNSYSFEKFNTSNLSGGSISTADTDGGPYSLAISPDGLYAYVVNLSDTSIQEFDTANLSGGAVSRASTGNGPDYVILSPDGLYAYVANGLDNTIQKFDTSNLAAGALSTGNAGSGFLSVAISPDGLYAYVINKEDSLINKFDMSNLGAGAVSTGSTGNGPNSLAISPDGRFVYVIAGYSGVNGVIQKFDTSNLGAGSLSFTYTGDKPYAVTLSPDGLYAYVVNYFGKTIQKFDTSKLSAGALSTGATGVDPYSVAVSAGGTINASANILFNGTNSYNGGEANSSGTVNFNNASYNSGIAGGAVTFANASYNSGVLNGTGLFLGSSYNSGTINGGGVFGVLDGTETTYNTGIIYGGADFYASTFNDVTGVVTSTATFKNSAYNLGTVASAEVYSPSPRPIGGTINLGGVVNYYNYLICGDGIIKSPEVCDDGNTSSGDGCNATCSAIESGYVCPAANSPCVALKANEQTCTNGTQCISGFCTSAGRCTDQTVNSSCGIDEDCNLPLACINSICSAPGVSSHPVSQITVTAANSATTVIHGQTLQMSASILPSNATNKTVAWSVTNGTGTATISSSGDLSATSAGTITVKATATDGSNTFGTKDITITAVNVAVTGISITEHSATVSVGATHQFTATVTPANASNSGVSWSSSNTSIATVNSSGLVTGVSVGAAIVTATSIDGNYTDTTTVTINQVTGGGGGGGGYVLAPIQNIVTPITAPIQSVSQPVLDYIGQVINQIQQSIFKLFGAKPKAPVIPTTTSPTNLQPTNSPPAQTQIITTVNQAEQVKVYKKILTALISLLGLFVSQPPQ